MTTTHCTITVQADPDQDDCLSAAAEEYLADHPDLEGYDLQPRWGDADRETVALTVPAWVTGIDDDDIRALRTEAGEAGDLDQVALCDAALAGDEAARQECVEVILEARAQS